MDMTLREIPDHRERQQWRTAPNRTEEAWRRCFHRERAENVDRQLSLVGSERGVAATGRDCARCGGDVTRRDARALYCSDRCRKMPLAA